MSGFPARRESHPHHHKKHVPFGTTRRQMPHPIHLIPPELLSYIFILASYQEVMFPVRVSHVCRNWRDLALRTPALWTQICLDLRGNMWAERVLRARACSLDVRLLPWATTGGHKYHQVLDFYTVQRLIHLVTPYIPRWRSLEIEFVQYAPYLWNAALSQCCSREIDSEADMLERLSLVYPGNDDPKEFCLFSGYAPRLRHLRVDGIRLTWLPSLFENLTYLDYTHSFTTGTYAVLEVVSILRVSFNLTELRILFPRQRKPRSSPPSSAPPKRVTIPYLKILHLVSETGDIPYELTHLASLLSTPSLTSLHLIDSKCQDKQFPSLRRFFQLYVFPPSIRIMSLAHGWYDRSLLTSALRRLSAIEQLAIRQRGVADQFYHFQRSDLRRHSRRTHNAS